MSILIAAESLMVYPKTFEKELNLQEFNIFF